MAEVRLPHIHRPGNETHGDLAAELQDPDRLCCGEQLAMLWGDLYRGPDDDGLAEYRYVCRLFRRPTLEAAEAMARAWHAKGAAVIDGVLAARRARLAQREATIAAAHARPGTIEIPEGSC
jgi:hypothetical protein